MSAAERVGKLASTLTVPIVFLNSIGMVVTGLILLFIGYWKLVVGGLFLGAVACYGVGLVLLPSLLAIPLINYAANHGRKLLLGLTVGVSNLYHAAWISVWCCAVVYSFTGFAHSFGSLLLLLVWTYGVATSPLTWVAKQESEGATAFIFALFAQASFLLLIGYILIAAPNIVVMFAIIILMMLCAAIFSTLVALEMIEVSALA